MLRTAFALLTDLSPLVALVFRSRAELAAENLFLRKQLACYLERQVRPHRTDNASRIALVALSRRVDWRDLLTIVRPETLVRWHRDLSRLLWRVRSRRRGRPRIPAALQQLIVDMAAANRTWGEGRIAAELRLKLGLTVSPRTVRRYMPRRPRAGPRTQSWASFLRHHAGAVLACDFFVVVTATFQRVDVFVILDIATRHAEDDSVLLPPGPDCPSPVGFCASSDRVRGSHGFSGTFFFQALAFEPIASDPAGRLVVSGISTFTTSDGTLTISDVSVFDPAPPQGLGTGTFSGIGRISGGTGSFAGATGDVFTMGRTREGGTALTTNTTLQICLP